MDIIDTRTNLVGIAIVLKGIEQFHVTLGSLDRNNISVKALNRRENIVKVRVAKVRVSLKLISDTSCCKLERVYSPLKIAIPVSPAEGKLQSINHYNPSKRR